MINKILSPLAYNDIHASLKFSLYKRRIFGGSLLSLFALLACTSAMGTGYQSSVKSVVRETNMVSIMNKGATLDNTGYTLFLRANPNGGWNDGDNCEVWQWNNWDSQRWVLQRISGTQYKIKLKNSNYYLRANPNGSWNDGDNVEINTWKNWGSQKWELDFLQHGYTRMKVSSTDRYMRAYTGGDGWDDADNAEIDTWWESRALQWDIEMIENVDSPFIIKSPNGDLVAYLKHKLYTGTAVGYIYRSSNGGVTWGNNVPAGRDWGTPNAQFSPAIYAPSLFTHNNTLYLIGCNSSNSLIIRTSSDNGDTWSAETVIKAYADDLQSGGGGPVLFANGYIYYTFMVQDDSGSWPAFNGITVASCSATALLTNPNNWTVSSSEYFPNSPAVTNTRGGWLEANAVESPDGRIMLFTRVDSDNGSIAAVLQLSGDRTDLEFNNTYPVNYPGQPGGIKTGFMDATWAGSQKFHIQYDSHTDKYWIMSNPHRGPKANISPHKSAELPDDERWYDRNELVLFSTANFEDFTEEAVLISDDLITDAQDSVNMTGFQQPCFFIDGSMMKFISRTAYGTFDVWHDANIISYHEYKYRD